MLPGQLAQGLALLRCQLNGTGRSGMALLRWPWPVQGQRQQRRGAGQRLLPIAALLLKIRRMQLTLLPDGVINILQRQRGQQFVQCERCDGGRVLAAIKPLPGSRIQRGKFTHEYVQRPAIGDQMVHDHTQFLLCCGHTFAGFAGLPPQHAQQRPLIQDERLRDEFLNVLVRFGRTALQQ